MSDHQKVSDHKKVSDHRCPIPFFHPVVVEVSDQQKVFADKIMELMRSDMEAWCEDKQKEAMALDKEFEEEEKDCMYREFDPREVYKKCLYRALWKKNKEERVVVKALLLEKAQNIISEWLPKIERAESAAKRVRFQ